MKKTLLIAISIVVTFIAGISESEAQISWSATVNWNDNSCSCATITSKVIEWELRKVSDNSLIASGDIDVTNNSSNTQLISESDQIYTDTAYKLIAKVSYYEASAVPLCCFGSNYGITDGQGLIDGDLIINVSLN